MAMPEFSEHGARWFSTDCLTAFSHAWPRRHGPSEIRCVPHLKCMTITSGVLFYTGMPYRCCASSASSPIMLGTSRKKKGYISSLGRWVFAQLSCLSSRSSKPLWQHVIKKEVWEEKYFWPANPDLKWSIYRVKNPCVYPTQIIFVFPNSEYCLPV